LVSSPEQSRAEQSRAEQDNSAFLCFHNRLRQDVVRLPFLADGLRPFRLIFGTNMICYKRQHAIGTLIRHSDASNLEGE